MSLTTKAIAAALLCAALIFGWSRLTAHYEDRGYQRRVAEDREAAEAQTARNRELQRAAEKRYVVEAGVRDRFITKTAKEIRDASAPLASCPVPDRSVRLLNDARACASGDSAAACGAGDGVPAAR